MINLLPLEEKKYAFHIYRMHRAIIVAWALLVTLLVGALVALPSFFSASVKEKSLREQIAIAEKSPASEKERSLEAAIREANEKITILAQKKIPVAPPIGAQTNASALFSEIIRKKPANITIQNFSFTQEAGGKDSPETVRINLVGISETRGTLTSFSDTLRRDERFESATFPAGNLVEDRNIEFSLSIVLAKR